MNLPKSMQELIIFLQKNQRFSFIFILVIAFFLFWIWGGNSQEELFKIDSKIAKPEIKSVQDAVDPRAIWADNIAKQIEAQSIKLEVALKEQGELNQEAINGLQKEIEDIKAQNLSNNNNNSNLNEENANISIIEEAKQETKTQSNLGHLHLDEHNRPIKNTEDYVTSGSFARSVLLTGVVAETGTDSASSPQPILLRLVDVGIFSKGYKTEQIKEAILIGSCYGNISSERAICRLETLSLMNNENKIIEKPVEGWVIGEDGRPGIKGEVVDKSSDITRLAVLNGILGGMAGFFQNQAQSSVFPISPIIGQTNSLSSMDSLKAGGAAGVGNALQKLADYAIKRAEQMSPVIVIGAGRTVDVVFKKGFQLKDENSLADNISDRVQSISGKENSNQKPATSEGGYNQGINTLKNLQMNKGTF
jgi:conjugal transfer pilus assembly protein TraB